MACCSDARVLRTLPVTIERGDGFSAAVHRQHQGHTLDLLDCAVVLGHPASLLPRRAEQYHDAWLELPRPEATQCHIYT